MNTPKSSLTIIESAVAFTIGVVAAALIIAVVTIILMLAWNYLAVSLFHLPTVKFWQMFVIIFLVGQAKRLLK